MNPSVKNISLGETRRRNLILLIHHSNIKSYRQFNHLLKTSETNASIRQIIRLTPIGKKEKKPRQMGNGIAREIEYAFNLPEFWLDEPRICPQWLIDVVEKKLDHYSVEDLDKQIYDAGFEGLAQFYDTKNPELLTSLSLYDLLTAKGYLKPHRQAQKEYNDLRLFVVKNDFLKSIVKAGEIIAVDFAIQSFCGFGIYLIDRNGIAELMIIDNSEDSRLKMYDDYREETLINFDDLKILGRMKYSFNVTSY